jgi:hypothetical protein
MPSEALEMSGALEKEAGRRYQLGVNLRIDDPPREFERKLNSVENGKGAVLTVVCAYQLMPFPQRFSFIQI